MSTLPDTWQADILAFLRDKRKTDPTKVIFGLTLPESWKGSLWSAFKGGQLHRMFGVRSVAFSGEKMGTFNKGDSVSSATPAKPAAKSKG